MNQSGLQHYTVESCALQLNSWKPFLPSSELSTLNSVSETALGSTVGSSDLSLNLNGLMEMLGEQMQIGTGPAKKQCLSDRGTCKNLCDFLDMNKLSLLEDESKRPQRAEKTSSLDRIYHRSIPLISSAHMARKRRRRGSRSGSGKSSDKSRSRNRVNGSDPPTRGASAAYATCSDFPIAGTDSSGELFYNGDGNCNWASEMIIPVTLSEVKNPSKKDGRDGGGDPVFSWQGIDIQSNESGYGSEPGYRGDGELGYGEDGAGDELDEEEEDDDVRIAFWDNVVVCGSVLGNIGQPNCDMSEDDDEPSLNDHMHLVGKSVSQEQRLHHRFRRRRQDWRMMEPHGSRNSLVTQNN